MGSAGSLLKISHVSPHKQLEDRADAATRYPGIRRIAGKLGIRQLSEVDGTVAAISGVDPWFWMGNHLCSLH